jgi:molybdopterin-guanine dinucleotide biosynthesis protein A
MPSASTSDDAAGVRIRTSATSTVRRVARSGAAIIAAMAAPSAPQPPLVAVLAGGRATRMGGAKSVARLAGRPLIERPLDAAAAAGLAAVVVCKASTRLPEDLEAPVWTEPEEPVHPLAGVVHALERAGGRDVIVVAADMPFVSAALLERLRDAPAPAVARTSERWEPLLARYGPAALRALRAALAAQAPLCATVAELAPAAIDVPLLAARSVNDPTALAAAEAELSAAPRP